VRADAQKGELFFRLMRPVDVFQRTNLVYVKAQTDGVTSYGESVRLDVRPLNRIGNQRSRYFIPDTLYSERRGWLNTTSRIQSGIFLARVNQSTQKGDGLDVKLSLVDNPFRRFGLLFQVPRRQAIIKERKQNVLRVELSEGVNVEVPWQRIDWSHPEWQNIQPGDVISFTPQIETSRISVTDVRCSHFAYLQSDAPTTLLTMLWGSPETRWKKLMEKDLNCSLIGLPLLKGICHPTDEHIKSTRPLPQVVDQMVQDKWVRLKDVHDTSSR